MTAMTGLAPAAPRIAPAPPSAPASGHASASAPSSSPSSSSGRSSVPPCADAAAGTVELLTPSGWFAVCEADALESGRGVAALLPGGAQAAVFRDSGGRLYAIGNVDPFTGAGVLCHGLTGSAGGRPYVASPLLKQRFALDDGRCLDDDEVAVPSYPLRVR